MYTARNTSTYSTQDLATPKLLTEDGGFLLQETGFNLLLEGGNLTTVGPSENRNTNTYSFASRN